MMIALVAIGLAADPPSIVGTWNVRLKSESITCPKVAGEGGERAVQWLVSTGSDGNYTVQVIGDTSGLTSLKGPAKDGSLTLFGGATKEVPGHDALVLIRSAQLRLADGKLTGSYLSTSVAESQKVEGGGYVHPICATMWSVTATR
jgi:hypothetical protein